MPKIPEWSREDGISSGDVNEVAGWAHDVQEASLYVGKRNGVYFVELYDGEKMLTSNGRSKETLADRIETRSRAMEIAREELRNHRIERDETTREMDKKIHDYYVGRVVRDFDSDTMHNVIAFVLNEDYDFYVRDDRQGSSEQVSVRTGQHDHSVYLPNPYARSSVVSKNYEIEVAEYRDYHLGDLIDAYLEENGLYTVDVYKKAKRYEVYGDEGPPSITEDIQNIAARFLARKFVDDLPPAVEAVGEIKDSGYLHIR